MHKGAAAAKQQYSARSGSFATHDPSSDLGQLACQKMMTKPQWAAVRAKAERRQAVVLQKAENVLHD